ncbi:MAG TPA: hypothetical protein VEP91_05260 [Solirubrobacterales bacterium]|nr:hypothetical protein [Solirubrobacterales bacterium]
MIDKLRFPARFDAGAFREYVAGSSPVGQGAAEIARRDYEANGVPVSDLRPCDPEGRDGTVLPQCLKLYIPPPVGRFGMVFRFVVANDAPRLDYLAFGVRHHPAGANAPTVYEIAHRRLHD